MTQLQCAKPADGSRVVWDSSEAVLFGQPPEVLKGLLLAGVERIDTLVLIETCERDGSLLNNLEFPLYFFLFVGDGLAQGRKLNLVGQADAISRALRLLRLTLVGPTAAELSEWQTPVALQQEWLAASRHLALKDADGKPRDVTTFFNIIPFEDGLARTPNLEIRHLGGDRYRVTNRGGRLTGDGLSDL